ncbi:Clp protease N-terminal domain-containing protein [Paractinoplanes maris]|uniref:Clp protease N-terminal domain-containing protein n=1 Tax=Paractinoplanes maris TaxID=1734446 RepID=UPI00202038B0|nr:Clp protease N-terminal domain-containing protein [Actinoplanes maris]
MFERFTAGARAVVTNAQSEARSLRHNHIGTEHVLLALLADPDGPVARSTGLTAEAVRVDVLERIGGHSQDGPVLSDADAEDAAALKAIGIDLAAVREAIEANFGAGALRLPRPPEKKRGLFAKFSPTSGHIPFTNRNKKVLELSLREALRLKQKFIAPEHIMLGLLREGHGLAALIMVDRGVDLDRLRQDMERTVTAATQPR